MNCCTRGLLGVLALFASAGASHGADADWKQRVSQILGRAGQESGEVYRIGLARSDLRVTVDGVEIKPALALGSWLAFMPAGNETMVMGDLVLTQDEVSPVMTELQEGGIDVTALHNHLLRNEPFTMYMHVLGHGDPVKLATTLRQAIGHTGTPLGATSAGGGTGAPSGSAVELDTAMIERVLGYKGKANAGIYAVSIPRAHPVLDGGMEIPEAMGSAIAINVQPAERGQVAATGDFVLSAPEVNPVMKALREHAIEVTAIHNHMLDDQPRLFFMHFWAHGETGKVATGLRAALDRVDARKP